MYALKQVATQDVLYWKMYNGWVGGRRRRGGREGLGIFLPLKYFYRGYRTVDEQCFLSRVRNLTTRPSSRSKKNKIKTRTTQAHTGNYWSSS